MTDVDSAVARRRVLTVALVLLLLAAWNGYRGRDALAIGLGVVGLGLLLTGSFVPSWSRRFDVAWMSLASCLGYVNSRVLLTILFFVLIAPVGFTSRRLGRDPLKRRGGSRATYWIPRDKECQTRDGFERTF